MIMTTTRRPPDLSGVEYALDGETLVITSPRAGRKRPLVEAYTLARHAGGFTLTKSSGERHYVAGGTCSCKAFEFGGECKHRKTLIALLREGRIS